jgi:hypothetical protein
MSNRKTIMSQMKNLAEILVQHTYPKANFEEEQTVSILKQRMVIVDGYEVFLCFSIADYDKYILHTLQIQSVHTPFLPFNIVCKLGREFFGSKGLSYIEFLRNDKKIYCWILKFKNGSLISENKSKLEVYEDFEFRILNPGSLDLL